ncbi:MAG TPA: TOBE domain-containing protein [Thiotrichales bacterium]|nr:TOBE domain-containing protein [Thiotrichales bacterium]
MSESASDMPSLTVAQPEFFAPWHVRLGTGEISPRRLFLLQAIDATGSISQAAKQVGITYKAAWDAVDAMNNLAGQPLVVSQHGGKGGGGAHLTHAGMQIVMMHERLSAMQAIWTASLEGVDADVLPMLRRLTMQTSARNAFVGQVKTIKHGAVNAEVILALQGGDELVATVTDDSVERMQLKVGSQAWGLIKASWVILALPDASMKTSARNRLCGVVSRLSHGPVNTEVVLQLDGGNTLTAVVTHDSAQELNLAEGKPCCALIKASHVLLGVDA